MRGDSTQLCDPGLAPKYPLSAPLSLQKLCQKKRKEAGSAPAVRYRIPPLAKHYRISSSSKQPVTDHVVQQAEGGGIFLLWLLFDWEEICQPAQEATSKIIPRLNMSEILRELLRASEKAACIARACRQEENLFQLLIEEKKEGERNKKFATDFKTLADVLVQEVIKHDIGKKFPGLEKQIAGEESNEFTNELGEKILVKVCATEEETTKLLQKVLDGNEAASKTLAQAVHQEVTLTDPALDAVSVDIPQSNIAMWVDPIDSTYQYIKGSADIKPTHGIYPKGLQCVTVLIGAYEIDTGLPIMGVINQPFATRDPKTLRWKSQWYWGLSYMNTNVCSLQFSIANGDTCGQSTNACPQHSEPGKHSYSAVTSSAETKSILGSLTTVCGEDLYFAAGAGYKCLCVVQNLVDFYVFSEDTTFKWDSCAPHAILRSLGGGILDLSLYLESMRQRKNLSEKPHLLYNREVDGASGADRWANKGGLVAYRSEQQLEGFMELFVQNLSSKCTT